MTELKDHALIPLTDVPTHVVSHPSMNSVRRWAGRGVRGVRLRTWLIGGRRYTTSEAIDHFVRSLSAIPSHSCS